MTAAVAFAIENICGTPRGGHIILIPRLKLAVTVHDPRTRDELDRGPAVCRCLLPSSSPSLRTSPARPTRSASRSPGTARHP